SAHRRDRFAEQVWGEPHDSCSFRSCHPTCHPTDFFETSRELSKPPGRTAPKDALGRGCPVLEFRACPISFVRNRADSYTSEYCSMSFSLPWRPHAPAFLYCEICRWPTMPWARLLLF